MRAAARLYQIAWSAQTLAALDSGFEVLDHQGNERADWREYWPIRRFLQTQALDEGAHYGFFSPRFREKTGLDAATTRRFVEDSDADVVGFSPFFDQMAFHRNIFTHAAVCHPALEPALRQCLQALAPGLDMDTLVMDASDTIFCNFFAARPAFWRAWLALGERVYAQAEQADAPLAALLNLPIAYGRPERAPAKVFVIERLASLLLVTQQARWTVRAYNPLSLPCSVPENQPYAAALVAMDALKRAWRTTGHPQYLHAWQALVAQLAAGAADGAARERALVAAGPLAAR